MFQLNCCDWPSFSRPFEPVTEIVALALPIRSFTVRTSAAVRSRTWPLLIARFASSWPRSDTEMSWPFKRATHCIALMKN